MSPLQFRARRQLLRFLLASPLLALADEEALIADPGDALNVFEFESLARRKLPPAHWGYLATGVDDDATLRANREGFNKLALRVRRMVDVSSIDTSVSLFGTRWETPIVLAPVSSQQAFHPEGEVAVARAAATAKHLQILSTLASQSIEQVNAARGEPVWYQLYATDQWDVTVGLMQRARAAGCTVMVVTADLNGGSNREAMARWRRSDQRQCSGCHDSEPGGAGRLQSKAMFKGLDTSRVRSVTTPGMTWDMLDRMREHWPGKLLVKGIVTREDAQLAVRYGADGVIVSNHGGRAEESGRGTIDSLPEVVAGARGRIPVLIDSGFRRGTDIFKALALGASAVCIGRPYIWGLASFGEPGVAAVLRILRRELTTVMRQAGARTRAQITAAMLMNDQP
jgi:isopentenyl diphosphate isomerase/L-lactate dehydrogenase-like FMN-dependent dehydrogenase